MWIVNKCEVEGASFLGIYQFAITLQYAIEESTPLDNP